MFFVRIVVMEQFKFKNFDRWNQEKKKIDQTLYGRFHFHEREIWWCSLGLNIGDEQDGKNEWFERPVLVVKKFNEKIALILPMTSKPKVGNYYHSIKYGDKTTTVILSQLRLVSVKRFRRFVRKISEEQFCKVTGRLESLLNFKRSLLSEAPRGPSGHL